MDHAPSLETPLWLRRFTKVVAASTLFLIFAGAMVTSTGSGLAVPDWPLSYGMLMPPMVAGIFYEHGHRMIATGVGLLTIIQAVWLQRREPKRFVRIMGWVALGAVIVQGVLGGITVLFLLPPAVSIGHAGLAELFLCLNTAIAFFTSRAFHRMRGEQRVDDAPVALSTALAAVVYLQILAGALVRHLGAGVAIPDFPLSFGRLVPEMTTPGIAANFAHRVGALLVTLLLLIVLPKALRVASSGVRRTAAVLATLVAIQVVLGASIVWLAGGNEKIYHSLAGEEAMRHAMITSLHVLTGAATLMTSVLLALGTRVVARPRSAPASQLVPTEVAA